FLFRVAASSFHSASPKLAQPSFSHRCSHPLHVMRSPVHWWQSSCEMMSSDCPRAELACIVVIEVFSIPPQLKCRTHACAYLSHAYGSSNFFAKNAIMLGVLP